MTTASRSVEEIVTHADELAARFEDYDPKDGDELDIPATVAGETAGRFVARG